ncbi:helix-turn-helix transcriptional regulator [Halolamina sp. R1-12]|nr:helix-turn-helix transcriptional regulator [Halolamina sp. R1-12]
MRVQEADPTDALAVLGDETRIAILRALAEAEEPLPFSELRRRADVRDPGRFNYHLSKLREYFVREEDGGYALREAGSRVVAAAGVVPGPTTSVDDAPQPDAGTDNADGCPVCGEEDCERLFHVHLSVPWR